MAVSGMLKELSCLRCRLLTFSCLLVRPVFGQMNVSLDSTGCDGNLDTQLMCRLMQLSRMNPAGVVSLYPSLNSKLTGGR